MAAIRRDGFTATTGGSELERAAPGQLPPGSQRVFRAQGLLDILSGLTERGASGSLRFSHRSDESYRAGFLLCQGKVMSGFSNQLDETLIAYLYSHVGLKQAILGPAMADVMTKRLSISQAILRRGLAPREIVAGWIYEHVEHLVDRILDREQGMFVFEHHEPGWEEREMPSAEETKLRALFSFPRVWTRLAERSRWQELLLYRPSESGQQAPTGLQPFEQRLLSAACKPLSVHRILSQSSRRLTLMIALSQLLGRNLLEVRRRQSPSAPPPGPTPRARLSPSLKRNSPLPSSGVGALVPSLAEGICLEELTFDGLSMDEILLISQIDGRRSLDELPCTSGQPTHHSRRVLARLLRRGLVQLRPPSERVPSPAPEPPPMRIVLGSRPSAIETARWSLPRGQTR